MSEINVNLYDTIGRLYVTTEGQAARIRQLEAENKRLGGDLTNTIAEVLKLTEEVQRFKVATGQKVTTWESEEGQPPQIETAEETNGQS